MTQQDGKQAIVEGQPTMTCTAVSASGNICTRPSGHDGAHGLELEPGLVLAPWQGAFRADEAKPSGLECDVCGHELRLNLDGDTAVYSCVCDQSHTFLRDGQHYQTRCTIFTTNPTPAVALKQLPEKLMRAEWELRAMRVCGYLTPEEFTTRLREQRRVVTEVAERLCAELQRRSGIRGWFRGWKAGMR